MYLLIDKRQEKKLPHTRSVKVSGATNRKDIGHVQPTDALTGRLSTCKKVTAIVECAAWRGGTGLCITSESVEKPSLNKS